MNTNLIIISYDYNTWKNCVNDLHFPRSVLQNIAFFHRIGGVLNMFENSTYQFLVCKHFSSEKGGIAEKGYVLAAWLVGKHAKLCDQYLGGLEEVEWTREVYVSVVEHWVFSKLLTLAKAFLLPKEQDTTNTVREFTTVQADVISKNIVPPPPNGQFFLVQRGPSKCLGEVRTQLIILYF